MFLHQAHSQLTAYMERYKTRLKAKNLLYIKQILFVFAAFLKTLGWKNGQDPSLHREKGAAVHSRFQYEL